MNREEIIRMARNEYGIYAFTAESLAEFATIIDAAARAEENEACAKVCEDMDHNGVMIAADCAAAIRARGEK